MPSSGEESGMKRRTLLMKSMLGVGGLAGVADAGLAKAEADPLGDGSTGPSGSLGLRVAIIA
jgi:hypothetical protein